MSDAGETASTSSGFAQLATNLGSFGQSVGYNILSNSASQIGTNAAFGNDLTFGTIVGSAIGGYVGAKFGNWSGVKGGWFKNALSELGFSALKGGHTGAVSGLTSALIDGEDLAMGFKNGMINGAIGHTVGAGINIGLWGATTTLPPAAESKIQESEKFFGPLKMGENRPAYRKGGLYQLAFKREVTWGRNIMVNKNTSTSTYVHETMHYYQQMYQGFGYYQSKGIYEIGVLEGLRGINPYNLPGTNEYEATFYEWFFMRRGYYTGY